MKPTKLLARCAAAPATPARLAKASGCIDEAALLGDLRLPVQAAHQRIANVANTTYTRLCWQVGSRMLSELLQAGRASYGKQILATVSQELTAEFGARVVVRTCSRNDRHIEHKLGSLFEGLPA